MSRKRTQSEELGRRVAQDLFQTFGPESKGRFRGPKFVYPDTLFEMVSKFSEAHAGLAKLDKEIARKTAISEMRRLVKE